MDEIRRINLQLFAADGDAGGQEPQDEPAAGTADDSQAEPGDGGQDLDPAALRRELERARKEAARYRTERKQWQDQLQQLKDSVAKALGIKDDKEIEADKLAARVQQLEARYRQERLKSAFWRLAEKHGADAELTYALLHTAGDLDELDVEAENFEDALSERIKSAVESNPKLRRDAAPPKPVGGGTNPPGVADKGVPNPWSKEHFNLTEQGRILRENPQLAERLMREAGVRR